MPSTITSLLARGYALIALRPRSKHPLRSCDQCSTRNAPCRDSTITCPCLTTPTAVCHGVRAASSDPDVIAEWAARWPRANWGIACTPSNLIAIDLDTKTHHPPAHVLPNELGIGQPHPQDGIDLFGTVARNYGHVERIQTRIIRTASGGLHVLFQAPKGIDYQSSTGYDSTNGHLTGLGWSIDVRARGGYIVAPGSVTNSGRYHVLRDMPEAPLPDWLESWLTLTRHQVDLRDTHRAALPPPQRAPSSATRAARYATAALNAEVAEIAEMAPNTGRNARLNRAAYALGGYVAKGALAEADVIDALAEAARACGLGEGEAARTIRSGITAGMRAPRRMGGAA